jgi:phosphoglycolate phosphatase-like HAD superfamily hydrolase
MDGTLTPPGLIDFPYLRSSIRSIASSDPMNDVVGGLNLDEDALILASQLSPAGQVKCSAVLKEVEEKVLREISLNPGVVSVLRYCNEVNLKAAVVTRNIEKVTSRLVDLVGITRSDGKFVLDPMLARNSVNPKTGEVIRAKPNPDALIMVCETWGLEVGEVVMVGDSLEDDVQAAGRAGCRSLLIDTGCEYFSLLSGAFRNL